MAAVNTPKFFLVVGNNSGASPVSLMLHQLGVYMGKNFFKIAGSEESSGEDYRVRMLLKKFYTPLLDNERLEDSYRRSFKIALYNCVGKLIEEKDETWRSGTNQNSFKYAGLKIPPFAEIILVIRELIEGDVLLVNCVRDREESIASMLARDPDKSKEEIEAQFDKIEKKREELAGLFTPDKILTLDYKHVLNSSKLAAYRLIKFGELDTQYTDVRDAVQHIYNFKDDIIIEDNESSSNSEEVAKTTVAEEPVADDVIETTVAEETMQTGSSDALKKKSLE